MSLLWAFEIALCNTKFTLILSTWNAIYAFKFLPFLSNIFYDNCSSSTQNVNRLPFLFPSHTASSVSVSAWTLVAISCERYYAICHPLRSRRWQTLRHSYKLIALIWCGSLICMSPIAFLSQLIPTSNGKQPNIILPSLYNVFCIRVYTYTLYINRVRLNGMEWNLNRVDCCN